LKRLPKSRISIALLASDTRIGTGFVVSALAMLYYCYYYRLASQANKTEKNDDLDLKPIKIRIRIFDAPENVDVRCFW
jgi:hypothetical protein